MLEDALKSLKIFVVVVEKDAVDGSKSGWSRESNTQPALSGGVRILIWPMLSFVSLARTRLSGWKPNKNFVD